MLNEEYYYYVEFLCCHPHLKIKAIILGLYQIFSIWFHATCRKLCALGKHLYNSLIDTQTGKFAEYPDNFNFKELMVSI